MPENLHFEVAGASFANGIRFPQSIRNGVRMLQTRLGKLPTSVVAVLVAGLLLVGLTMVTSVGAQESESASDSGDTKESISTAISNLSTEAMTRWPDEFGAVRIQPGRPELGIEVGFTDDAVGKVEELAKDFAFPKLLVPVTIPKSRKTLGEEIQEIALDRTAAQKGLGPLAETTGGLFDLQSELFEGTVEVIVPDIDAEQRSLFRAEYGADVNVIEGGLGHPASCQNRLRCGKDLRAGIRARNVEDFTTARCSTGFTVMYNDELHILSAAHCSSNTYPSYPGLPGYGTTLGQSRYHGDPANGNITEFGTVQRRYLFGGVDAELVSVESSFQTFPWVYREDTDQEYPVRSMGLASGIFWGQTLCRAGATSGRRCGTVSNLQYSPVRGGGNFFRFTACSGSGDSGGPVFEGTRAWGLFDGWIYINNNPPPCDNLPASNQVDSYFGALSWALNNLEATMVYTP